MLIWEERKLTGGLNEVASEVEKGKGVGVK